MLQQEVTLRIIKHMNKDHQLALVDYVVVYGNVRASEIVKSSVNMVDVDKNKITIVYDSTKSKVPQTVSIDWESADELENITVKGLKDIKGKLVSMAKFAASKQGYSHQRINKVVPPRQGILMYILFGFLALGVYDIKALKESLAADPIVSKIVPFLPTFAFKVLLITEKNILLIFCSLYCIHIIEILFVMIPMSIKYRLPPSKKFIWCAMQFIEGFFCYNRFKALINDN